MGVAFRLAEGLLRARLTEPEAAAAVERLVELAAIGTLADSMPLVGENRTIVRLGLERLARTTRVGLQAMLRQARLLERSLSAEDVSFGIVPRLNAAGRLDHALPALDLLLTESVMEAERLVLRLDELNRERQVVTTECPAGAAGRTGWPAAGPGRCAGRRLSGRAPRPARRSAGGGTAARPVIVLRRDGEHCSGSARSVRGVNVVEAIGRGAEHLSRFGGHEMAAGLGFPAERVEAFRADICSSRR